VSIFPGTKKSGFVLMSFALFAGLIGSTPASAISGPNKNPGVNSELAVAAETPDRLEQEVIQVAQRHLDLKADVWGIEASQFKPSSVIDGLDDMSVVRFSQSVNDIEVANSLLALTVNQEGELLSYTKTISDYSGDEQRTISKVDATEYLKTLLAKKHRVLRDQIDVPEMDLVVVDSALVSDVPTGQYLAWRAITSIKNEASTVSMTYLNEDGTKVISSLPYIRGITTDPFVCDLQADSLDSDFEMPLGVVTDADDNRYIDVSGQTREFPLCGVNTLGRSTRSTATAIKNIERTWKYFESVLGQDITKEKYLGNIAPNINGDRLPRISAFTNVCAVDGDRSECPYVNAFWVPWFSDECESGACSGIYLGKGFDKADDVVAHELAHGVTFSLAFSSALVDKSETAALSEAISDIFGEATDQLYRASGERPDRNWSIGEDVQSGGYRNMRKPKVTKIDKNWIPRGSHDNSGPVNRLAYLLANGGEVGDVEIKALGTTPETPGLCTSRKECTGIIRMSRLVFAATSNLSASANYFDFGRELMNSCTTFVKNKSAGFKESTCKNVAAALKAQGFTKFSITGTTKLNQVKKGAESTITAKAKSATGAPVRGQKMALQVKQGGKWKTLKTARTSGSGKVKFTTKWKKTSTYRVISKTNGGAFSATGKELKVTVK
jgi:Zn-dependent metalloprotease